VKILNDADHEECGHADVPGELRVMSGDISWAHNSVGNTDGLKAYLYPEA